MLQYFWQPRSDLRSTVNNWCHANGSWTRQRNLIRYKSLAHWSTFSWHLISKITWPQWLLGLWVQICSNAWIFYFKCHFSIVYTVPLILARLCRKETCSTGFRCGTSSTSSSDSPPRSISSRRWAPTKINPRSNRWERILVTNHFINSCFVASD